MGMSTEKTKRAFEDCRMLIRSLGYVGPAAKIDTNKQVRFDHVDRRYDAFAHLVYMCGEGQRLIDETEKLYVESENNPEEADALYEKAVSRKEKAMRWLGFIQGALWGSGLVTIEMMKYINMSEGERDQPARS